MLLADDDNGSKNNLSFTVECEEEELELFSSATKDDGDDDDEVLGG